MQSKWQVDDQQERLTVAFECSAVNACVQLVLQEVAPKQVDVLVNNAGTLDSLSLSSGARGLISLLQAS